MEFGHRYIRTDVDVDRLSSLPDDLIYKILSFISIRQAIDMSVLSSRWRFIWISMPYLNFSSQEELSPKFVSNVLSRRNSQIPVSSAKLERDGYGSVISILNYTFSHNVQHLTLKWDSWDSIFGSRLSELRSRSLKHLTLIGDTHIPFTSTPSWDLPVLTTLHLHDITLPIDDKGGSCLFTKCTNLKNLSLSRCRITVKDAFIICHSQLSNLTLHNIYGYGCDVVNVVAPQLENLTVIHAFEKLSISSAPALTSLVIKHYSQLELSTQGLPSLEKADLCFRYLFLDEAHILVSLLEQLHNVKFLTLNLEILEFLCLQLGPISHRLSPFANLKILKFVTSHPKRVYLEVGVHKKVTMSTERITMVSCEEIRVMRNIVTTQKLIADFKKQSTKSALKKLWTKSALELQEMMAEKLSSCLQDIEGLLNELPASKRDVMQAAFSSVRDEAAIVTDNMMDSGIFFLANCFKMKNKLNKKYGPLV